MSSTPQCYILNDYQNSLDWKLPLCFVKKRHTEKIEASKIVAQSWRMKERMKTVSVALVLCLNVGVDPPDIVKTQPCARLECWIDPLSASSQKALESIGMNLQKQYEKWQPRARYKQSLDPTVDDIKKLCTSLRRNAKEERVLFHYNGHGVPRPTVNGEIWVFNKNYTQYIPLSIYDLQTWMGSPSIYVYDCSNAGVIVDLFRQFADQHEKEYEQSSCQNSRSSSCTPPPTFKNCIQLAACSANQILPMNPDLPADIFTSCLTTPITIALKWYIMQNSSKLIPNISHDFIDKIPGQLNDRRTILGELNWIFTAITDTIAWNVLPRDLFHKLFRQDLLVASLFRNYLLAERIMRSYDCCPVSCPTLPATYQHPMWQAWDLSLDLCISQLPHIIDNPDLYIHPPFFEEQLTAFQVWLDIATENEGSPEQLPVVLQVLLSQVHRLRALELLSRFLDLGAWAVNLALSVGIFPYVLKLLQSSARELRPLLLFIWTKVLAVDKSCQVDLVRDNGHRYFLDVLHDPSALSDHKTMAAFVMSRVVEGYKVGQEVAVQGNLLSICLEQLGDTNVRLRQWLIVCLGRLWQGYETARWQGVRDIAHEKLYPYLKDNVPEVRASTVFALGTYMNWNTVIGHSEHANNIDQNVAVTLINVVSQDMSPLVRKELVSALQWIIIRFESSLLNVVSQEIKGGFNPYNSPDFISPSIYTLKRNISRERLKLSANSSPTNKSPDQLISSMASITINIESNNNNNNASNNHDKLKRVASSSSICSTSHSVHSGSSTGSSNSGNNVASFPARIWQELSTTDVDPFPSVAQASHNVTDYIRDQVFRWPLLKGNDDTTYNSMLVQGPSSLGTLTNIRDSILSRELCGRSRSAAAFFSLPPSPSNRSFLSPDSPPKTLTGSSSELNKLGNKIRSSIAAKKFLPNVVINEDGTVEERAKCLLKTELVEWCMKYFIEPSYNATPVIDIASDTYFERDWRYTRNNQLRKESKEECSRAGQFKLDNVTSSLKCNVTPTDMRFHPYDTHLIAVINDSFTVWDYQNGNKLSSWSPERPRGNNRIKALDLINAHDKTLLLTGTEDGCVRLWSNYYKEPTLVTAWQALPEIAHSNAGSPTATYYASSNNATAKMKVSWDQGTEQLMVAGECRFVKIWNARSELKTNEIPTGTESPVRSLSIDHSNGNTFAIGCEDGSIRVFDSRLPPHNAKLITYRDHTNPILTVKMRQTSPSILVAACDRGEIRMFDIRKKSPLITCRTGQSCTKADVHVSADIFALGGNDSVISIHDMDGTVLNTLKSYDWFLPSRISYALSSMTFHEKKVTLAYALKDSAINICSLESKNTQRL